MYIFAINVPLYIDLLIGLSGVLVGTMVHFPDIDFNYVNGFFTFMWCWFCSCVFMLVVRYKLVVRYDKNKYEENFHSYAFV